MDLYEIAGFQVQNRGVIDGGTDLGRSPQARPIHPGDDHGLFFSVFSFGTPGAPAGPYPTPSDHTILGKRGEYSTLVDPAR